MATNYTLLGKRIAKVRNQAGLSQESLSEKINISRTHISYIEIGSVHVSLDTLIDIANALSVSADDLLVDSLEHSASTADSKMHRIILDCTPTEEEILIRNAEHLKSILYSLGI